MGKDMQTKTSEPDKKDENAKKGVTAELGMNEDKQGQKDEDMRNFDGVTEEQDVSEDDQVQKEIDVMDLKGVTEDADEQVNERAQEEQDQENGDIDGDKAEDGLGQAMAAENGEIHEEAQEQDAEEGRKAVGMPSPIVVTRREREEHELTHLPYRSWCPHCVRGRGRNCPHHQGVKDKHDKEAMVPRVALDYFFLNEEDKVKETNPMMVMKEEASGEAYARMVEHKGLREGEDGTWIVSDILAELRSWGHRGGEGGHLILKSDGESSIVAVVDEVARRLGGKVITEKPAKGESQSNGAIEETGKTVREMAKVLKDAIEHKIKTKLKVEWAIMPWLIRWAAMLLSRYKVGADGKTGYERRRGRRCLIPLATFGEAVWYKRLEKDKGRNKFEIKWEKGIWLGHARDTNETLIGTKDGTTKAFACKRLPEDERWGVDLLTMMKGIPQRPNPLKPGLNIPLRVQIPEVPPDAVPPEPAVQREFQPRRLAITKKELDKYGYTPGCIGCEAKRRGGIAKKRTQRNLPNQN